MEYADLLATCCREDQSGRVERRWLVIDYVDADENELPRAPIASAGSRTERTKIHDLAYRWTRHRSDLHKIEPCISRQAERTSQRDDAHLLALRADQPNVGSFDFIVDAWINANGHLPQTGALTYRWDAPQPRDTIRGSLGVPVGVLGQVLCRQQSTAGEQRLVRA